MKYIITLSLLFSLFVCKSQKIDYNNFDKKLFETLLFEKVNNLRKSINVDTLCWSNILYKEVTTKQISTIVKEDRLFHPDMMKMWNDSTRVRNLLSNESEKKFGIKTVQSSFDGPRMMISENLFSGFNLNMTYEELVDFIVNGWDNSSGHKENQRGVYSTSNKPGFASCSVGVIPNKKKVYVVINFVYISRH
jgi:hypothetical protein